MKRVDSFRWHDDARERAAEAIRLTFEKARVARIRYAHSPNRRLSSWISINIIRLIKEAP